VTSHPRALLVGALALTVLGVPADGRAQVAAAKPIALVVLDDTRLVDGPLARLAAAGVEALRRAVTDTRAAVAAISSGPGGLSVDLSDDPSILPSIHRDCGRSKSGWPPVSIDGPGKPMRDHTAGSVK
jgi:hypothetical protein